MLNEELKSEYIVFIKDFAKVSKQNKRVEKEVAMYLKKMSIPAVVCLIAISAVAYAENAHIQPRHPEDRDLVIKLLKAIENDQYNAFVEGGSDYFKSRISQQHFHNVSERLGQHLRNGFDVIFLTEFKQAGLVGTLWKIEYRDGFDDALAKIFQEDGKIAGFWFQ